MKRATKKKPVKKEAKKVEFSYIDTAIDSLKVLFEKPKIFVPFAIMFLLSLALLPFTRSFMSMTLEQPSPQMIVSFLVKIFWFVLIAGIISILFYGWVFAMMKQLLKKGEDIDLKSTFYQIPHFAWKLLAVSVVIILLVFVMGILFSIVAILIAVLSAMLTKVSAIAGGIVMMLLYIVLFLISAYIFFGFMHLIPIIALKDMEVFRTVRETLRYMSDSIRHTCMIALIVVVVSIIFYIPSAVFYSSIGYFSNPSMLFQNTKYLIINQLMSIIYFVLLAWVIAFFSLAYARRNSISL